MTCLIGETPPGAAGTTAEALTGTEPRAPGRRFAYARAVRGASDEADGTSILETEPGIVRVLFQGLPSPFFVGSGPPTAFDQDQPPFAFATQSVFPSRESASAAGYQPLGTNPFVRAPRRLATSTTATASSSAFATKSVFPSGANASAFGVDPSGSASADGVPGPSGPSATEIWRTTVREATSMAATRFRFDWATKSVFPSGEKTRSEGWSAVFTVARTAPLTASTSDTDAAPQFETARTVPSGESTGR